MGLVILRACGMKHWKRCGGIVEGCGCVWRGAEGSGGERRGAEGSGAKEREGGNKDFQRRAMGAVRGKGVEDGSSEGRSVINRRSISARGAWDANALVTPTTPHQPPHIITTTPIVSDILSPYISAPVPRTSRPSLRS